MSSAPRRRPAESDNTDRSPPHGLRQDPPAPLSTSAGPVQSINPFVTAAMLRTNSVPWHVSPARPAILTSVTNVWAGVQDLTLGSLSLSEDVDDIHCVFCLAEDEEQARVRDPTLRSVPSAGPSFLRGRVVGKATYRFQHVMLCVVSKDGLILQRRDADECSRNEGSLDALIRPLRVSSADAATNSVHSASEPSTDRQPVTARYSAPSEPHQSQPRRASVQSPGVSIEQSGPRRSAKLAVAHPPRDSSTPASLRRSARLTSTQRR
jgi:hypothetical protein